jgi:nitrous oxide reductase
MLERQVSQEFDVLNDLVRDNDFLISSQGENPRLTKDDPIAPIEVLANNVRNKMIGAQSDFDRQNSRVGEIQKKVAEKNGKSIYQHAK